MGARPHASGAWLVLAVGLAAALVYAAVAPIVSDYQLFVPIWERVVAGLDPWVTEEGDLTWHTYGPLFNALALPYAIHRVLPRLLFVAAWFVAAGLLVARAASGRARPGLPMATALALGFSPLLWTQTAHFGKFDALVAVLCLGAIFLAQRGRGVSSGLLLAGAFGLKLYALPLVPFLALRERGIDWRLLVAFVVPSVLLFALAVAAWGDSVAVPFAIGAARGPTFLSIFRFLEGSGSPLPSEWRPVVGRLSLPLLAASGAAYFLAFLRRRIATPPACLLAMIVTFGLYKVGNQQLYIVLYLLSIHCLVERSVPTRGLVAGVVVFVVFINAVSVGHVLLDQYMRRWAVVRDWIGLPAFAVLVLLFVLVYRDALREARRGSPC